MNGLMRIYTMPSLKISDELKRRKSNTPGGMESSIGTIYAKAGIRGSRV
jgi:hypothetical protein